MHREESTRMGALFWHFRGPYGNGSQATSGLKRAEVKVLCLCLAILSSPLVASASFGPASATTMRLLNRTQPPDLGVSWVRMTVSMPADGRNGVGVIRVTVLSGERTERRTVRAPRRTLLLPSGATVTMTGRSIDPTLWSFQKWNVSPRGRPAYSSTRRQLRLTPHGPVAVRVGFVRVPTVTPATPAALSTATATPLASATDAPAQVVDPSPTPTIEPICRSWHPRPRCRFPTPTDTP